MTGTTGGDDTGLPCPASDGTHKVAPCGYYVDGKQVKTADGKVHLFRGLARPSLEWSINGQNISTLDIQRMAGWGANIIRYSLNQSFWLNGDPSTSGATAASYQSKIANFVKITEANGMDVILDLHWNDKNGQQQMADGNSTTFWKQVAAAYKGDGHVLFELYNEPHDISWSQWKSKFQELTDDVRNAGADNIVILGGLNWAADLSGVLSNAISGYNIMYASHPYQDKDWSGSATTVVAQYPVIFTEFGDRSGSCSTSVTDQVIKFADQHQAHWTGWAWWVVSSTDTNPNPCAFPTLISAWDGTPNAAGTLVKASLGQNKN